MSRRRRKPNNPTIAQDAAAPVAPPPDAPEPVTPEQAMAELQATMDRLGLMPAIMARGKTGSLSPIEDFLPESHTAILQFQLKR